MARKKAFSRNTPEEIRVIALALIDMNGDIATVSEQTGIAATTLTEWSNKRTYNRKIHKHGPLILKAEKFIEAMMQLILLKSGEMTAEQMAKAVQVMCGSINSLTTRHRLARSIAARAAREIKAKIEAGQPPPEKSAKRVIDPKVAAMSEPERWEAVVSEILNDPENTMSRDEVIDLLLTQRPDAAQYLRPEVPTIESSGNN